MITTTAAPAASTANVDRIALWKTVSKLERRAVELLTEGGDANMQQACALFAESVSMKRQDPFIQLAESYGAALATKDTSDILAVETTKSILADMKKVGVPPHLASLAKKSALLSPSAGLDDESGLPEEVDVSTTFSDSVTEKVRVKVSSYYDADKSDPSSGKYMFWYKVGIYNEGPEPVQIVARMWEIEKCRGEVETVRGSGIMNTQPIIAPGDVYTYQSVCPLKVFPPKGKRILGSMQGAYTMCKGNMGQHNFTVKVGKFNLILPEDVAAAIVASPAPSTEP
jgi:ApaG protein